MATSPHDGCVRAPATPAGAGSGHPDLAPDEELLRRYQGSTSPEDFAEITRRHWPMVFRASMRLVGNVHDAEDVAQSTFLALAQRPGAVRRSLAGYLHEQVRASASELFRSRRRRLKRDAEAGRDRAAAGSPSRAADRGELREELDAALARLPDGLKQAIILRYLEGHSLRDAALRAGCTPVTMAWRSMKGLEKLRTILGRKGLGLTGGAIAALLAAEGHVGTAAAGMATAGAGQAAGSLAGKFALGSLIRLAAAGLAILVPLALAVGVGPKLRRSPAPAAVAPAPAPPAVRPAPTPDLGMFDRTLDVGRPAQAGSAEHADGRFTIRASGARIYLAEDHFRFTCRPWEGDGEFIARVDVDPGQAAVQVAAGIMLRERLEANSLHAAILVTRSESRATHRGPDSRPLSHVAINDLPARGVQWVRLVRRGDHVTFSVRPDPATEWTVVKELDIPLARSLYAGLAVTSNDDNLVGTVSIDRVAFGP